MALAERITPRRAPRARQEMDVVLGDDWIAPNSTVEKEVRDRRNFAVFFRLSNLRSRERSLLLT